MKHKSVIIIGSGVAGLATAIRLAVAGLQVAVYEKNAYPGGKLSYFEHEGFCFDAGPSLFTQPWLIDELFTLAGKNPAEYFRYNRASETCRYFFPNGKRLVADASVQAFAQSAEKTLGEPAENVVKYLQQSSVLYHKTAALFLNKSLHKAGTYRGKDLVNAMLGAKPRYLLQTLDSYNNSAFRTPEMQQLFNRYATYNGSNPYAAPAMMSVIPHLEMNEGTYYPEGGMISITNALYQLALSLGVQFYFNNQVEEILLSQNVVKGVSVNGKAVLADRVVYNGDAYFAYKHLLHDDKSAAKILKQERSSSAFIFYWGINRTFPELGLHNIFFSSDYRAEFANIFKAKQVDGDPTVYVNITAKMESGQAPPDQENWFVMINVPSGTDRDWQQVKTDLRAVVIQKISSMLGVSIGDCIVTEAVLTPLDIEQKTMGYGGSLYGTSSNSRMAAFVRHPNFSSHITNLNFAGGSVHPGGGIPLCLRSAKIVAELIAKDHN